MDNHFERPLMLRRSGAQLLFGRKQLPKTVYGIRGPIRSCSHAAELPHTQALP